MTKLLRPFDAKAELNTLIAERKYFSKRLKTVDKEGGQFVLMQLEIIEKEISSILKKTGEKERLKIV